MLGNWCSRTMKKLDYILAGYFGLILLFIYAPILSVIVFSFNEGAGLSLPLTGFSTKWYIKFFNNKAAVTALIESVKLAVATMIITTILVVITALSFRRGLRFRTPLLYIILLGILTPGVIYGLGAAILYGQILNTSLSIWTAIPIEVIWTLPFGLILMLARFDPELATYEQAARTLGANEIQVFKQITLPLISVHVIAVALFSFTLTFGELLRTMFVMKNPPVLPLYIYSWTTNAALTPDFYAIGTFTISISFILLFIAGLLLSKGSGKKI